MTKIALMVGRYSHKGGLEKYARNLASAFCKKGCQVTVLTTECHETTDPIEIISLGERSKIALYQLMHFDTLCQKWLKENPQDIVFGMERTRRQDVYRAGSGVHKIYLQRRKQVESSLKNLSLTLNPLHRTICRYEQSAFEDPSLKLLFTNSNMVKNEICSHFTTDPNKIQVVHNGVEHTKFEKPFLEKSFQEEKVPTRFLFVGNGYLRKGLGFILPGLARLNKSEWQLTIVGKDKNEGYFKNKVKRLGISENVHFCGAQNDLIPFYQKADVLLIPSLYDPFANVTLEALAMGLFVVTSPFNGGKEILTPTMGHIIDDLFDPDATHVSLQRALKVATDKRGCEQRREAIAHLDFSQQLEKIISAVLSV